MKLKKTTQTISGNSPGQVLEFTGYTAGPEDADTTVYLQGATHAGEQPGILILHHFLDLLDTAAAKGDLDARFRVFPMVNPVGMGNLNFGQHQGRYDQLSGVNFNRDWPNVAAELGPVLAPDLTGSKTEILDRGRREIRQWLAGRKPVTARDQMRQLVMEQSHDADYVFDLHCDDDALVHLYAVPQLEEEMHELACWTGAAATLLAEDSGGGSFDEMWPALWLRLGRERPDLPVPMPVKSCTLEYRGEFDVFDSLNRQDALNLYAYFQTQGLIRGDLAAQRAKAPAPTDLRGLEFLRSEQPGLLAYQVSLGDEVKRGDVIADLVHLDGNQAFRRRSPIRAGTDGIVIARAQHKYTWPGEVVAKIAGESLLQHSSGYMLSD